MCAPFLLENENLSPLIRQHLLKIINDPRSTRLGVMVDVDVHYKLTVFAALI